MFLCTEIEFFFQILIQISVQSFTNICILEIFLDAGTDRVDEAHRRFFAFERAKMYRRGKGDGNIEKSG